MPISIFISYAHTDKQAMKIAQVLKSGIDSGQFIREWGIVWEDAEIFWDTFISKGDVWWNNILAQIQGCSHFIYMISSDSLLSEFCTLEHQWAEQLNRRRVYIKTDSKLKEHLIRRAISNRQFISGEKLDTIIHDILEQITSSPTRLPLPNMNGIKAPKCPTHPLQHIIDGIADFDELRDAKDFIYDLWIYSNQPKYQSDVTYLANQLKPKVEMSRSREAIERILKNIEQQDKTIINAIEILPLTTSTTSDFNISIESIRNIINLAYPQTTQEFATLRAKFKKCLVEQQINPSVLIEQLNLDVPFNDINSLASELVRNRDFLTNFILNANEIVPKLGNCLYNSCTEFASQEKLQLINFT